MFGTTFGTRPGAAGTRRRIATVAATVTLLSAGFWAFSVHNTPQAHAAVIVLGGINVSVNPNTTVVGIATVSATITYTCTDSSASDGRAALRVTFDQNNNDASGEVSVACGSTEIDQTQTVEAIQLGMSASQEITVTATLDDGLQSATDTPSTVQNSVYLHVNPNAAYNGDTVGLNGYYTCDPSVPTPTTAIVDAEQILTDNQGIFGSAPVAVTTCNKKVQLFSVIITAPNGVYDPSDPMSVYGVSELMGREPVLSEHTVAIIQCPTSSC